MQFPVGKDGKEWWNTMDGPFCFESLVDQKKLEIVPHVRNFRGQ